MHPRITSTPFLRTSEEAEARWFIDTLLQSTTSCPGLVADARIVHGRDILLLPIVLLAAGADGGNIVRLW